MYVYDEAYGVFFVLWIVCWVRYLCRVYEKEREREIEVSCGFFGFWFIFLIWDIRVHEYDDLTPHGVTKTKKDER